MLRMKPRICISNIMCIHNFLCLDTLSNFEPFSPCDATHSQKQFLLIVTTVSLTLRMFSEFYIRHVAFPLSGPRKFKLLTFLPESLSSYHYLHYL